jgi:hypothetical protein
MKRSEVSELLLSTADQFLAGFAQFNVDEGKQLDILLKLIERTAPELRPLMMAIAEGPDDPTQAQILAIRFLVAALIKLAAAAAAWLVISPLDTDALGPMAVIAGPKQ